MNLKDVIFEPHNDVCAEDIEMLNKHQNLIDSGKYSEATALLNNAGFKKGIRASLFNSIQNKIKKIQEYLLNEFVANKDEYYSYEEPDDNFMNENNYKFWCKLY